MKNYQYVDGGLKKMKKLQNTKPRQKLNTLSYLDHVEDDDDEDYSDDDEEYPVNRK